MVVWGGIMWLWFDGADWLSGMHQSFVSMAPLGPGIPGT